MKVVIIGAVAAGASAAARLRRLDEKAEIVLIEKGEFISYANCGLPYHLGGVIAERGSLLVMPPKKFAAWFNIDIRTRSEALAIDPAAKTVRVRSRERGEYEERYDKLLIATGARPAPDPLMPKAGDGLNVFNLWTLADLDRVKARIEGARKAVVVGAGFIGLEAAENLRARGMEVTVIQRGSHVLPTVDADMAKALAAELRGSGIHIRFGETVMGYARAAAGAESAAAGASCAGAAAGAESAAGAVTVALAGGGSIGADIVLVCTGVVPASELAKAAGLKCGGRGHIVVDEMMRTSASDIYAAGDVVEVADPILGGKTAIALAGPANKQGRIAADNIAGGASRYRGTFGTNVVKVGKMTAAGVGYSAERLAAMGIKFKTLWIHPNSNAAYYPGGSRLTIKALIGADGTIFGAQIVGMKGVDKRIDTIAVAMRAGLKAPQLGELELAYAPPYSSAKDPVNFIGFVAEDILTGKTRPLLPDEIPSGATVVDVREPIEHEAGAVPGAVNIPLGQIRARLGEIDRSRPVVIHCQVGMRGYLAERILAQNGFDAYNLAGGYLTWKLYQREGEAPKRGASCAAVAGASCAVAGAAEAPRETVAGASCAVSGAGAADLKPLDLRTLPCPGPLMAIRDGMEKLAAGARLRVWTSATFEGDLRRFVETCGYSIDALAVTAEGYVDATLSKGGAAAAATATAATSPATAASASAPATAASAPAPAKGGGNSVSIVLFSNDLDKALAAMILANGFAATGAKVSIFFTFWGLSVLRADGAAKVEKSLMGRMFGWMLPRGAKKLALSKMNMMGLGSAMIRGVMRSQKVLPLPELIKAAHESGVKFIACEMAMGVMGIKKEELLYVDEVAGVATFAALAGGGGTALFI